MNGSENGFAGALFFTLLTLGALLKLDDVIGLAAAAVCAISAATCLRRALSQAAMAAEDDHQRMEIQFQQLRQKINEGYTATAAAMNSVSEASETLEENLHGIRSRLSSLDNLTIIAETTSALGASMKSVEDSSAATEINVRRLGEKFSEVSDATAKNSETIAELSKTFTEEIKKIQSLVEENKSALQTGVKLVQVVGQILKDPVFMKDFEKLHKSAEKLSVLDELKKSFDETHAETSELARIAGEISNQNLSVVEAVANLENATLDSSENFKEVGKQMLAGTENLTAMFEDVRRELSTLTKKLDAYNGLARATLEQYSNLTEQDVRLLEKISERINGGRK